MTTAQRDAIGLGPPTPAEGLIVYDLDLHQMAYWNGTVWVLF
jgi:hypothetical protein